MKIVLHRQPVNVKQVTICRSKTGNKWYAVVACDVLRRPFSTIIKYVKPVGIDMCRYNQSSAATTLTTMQWKIQFLTRMLKPLKRAHRRVSRRQIGSSNREKAKCMLARLYERIQNKRKDFLHKTSAYYVSHYDLIFLERLRVANLTKNHRLARKILDASWSTPVKTCR